MTLPSDHARRFALNDEIHARPPEELVAPQRISFIALLADWSLREQQWEQIVDLAGRFGVAPPAAGATHYSADLGPFRIKWERHTEFSRYKFIAPGDGSVPFANPALSAVPADWLAGLLGEVMVASHVALLAKDHGTIDFETISARYFNGNVLAGGGVAGGAAIAATDFRIHADGFSRILVQDRSLTTRQAGRTIQRLVEIDAYRMMALLALPMARALGESLTRSERELAGITTALASATSEDEPALLDRLTRLEAEMESRYADNLFRFSASAAYYALVQRRIAELREKQAGLQTFHDFLERRLTPAMNTCQAAAARQESLSRRVARASQLLSTRVDITREGQNQALLGSMDRRAKLQLRLQETVEGLSVAAVTYYVVALVGHVADGLTAARLMTIDPPIVEAASVPVVALLTWLGVRRIRRIVSREHQGG